MRNVAFLFLLANSVNSFASETCYQVSANVDVWARTPELLCITETEVANQYDITLKSGLPTNQVTVATFKLDLIDRVRCMDCNQDVFAVANPENSSFNVLSIKFNGTRELASAPDDAKMSPPEVKLVEKGEVSIGSNVLYYRSL